MRSVSYVVLKMNLLIIYFSDAHLVEECVKIRKVVTGEFHAREIDRLEALANAYVRPKCFESWNNCCRGRCCCFIDME